MVTVCAINYQSAMVILDLENHKFANNYATTASRVRVR